MLDVVGGRCFGWWPAATVGPDHAVGAFGLACPTSELLVIEPTVGAMGREQLVVRAGLDDAAAFDDVDDVGGLDGREPVGHRDGRAAGNQLAERGLDLAFRH